MLYDVIAARAYTLYVKDWCDNRNKDFNTDYYNLKNYHDENGFSHGESFVCFREFCDYEFREEDYMKCILSGEDFELWQRVMKNEED